MKPVEAGGRFREWFRTLIGCPLLPEGDREIAINYLLLNRPIIVTDEAFNE